MSRANWKGVRCGWRGLIGAPVQMEVTPEGLLKFGLSFLSCLWCCLFMLLLVFIGVSSGGTRLLSGNVPFVSVSAASGNLMDDPWALTQELCHRV
jgi:hypothetical protein